MTVVHDKGAHDFLIEADVDTVIVASDSPIHYQRIQRPLFLWWSRSRRHHRNSLRSCDDVFSFRIFALASCDALLLLVVRVVVESFDHRQHCSTYSSFAG